MEKEVYLDFEEAVSFLKTTPSTLYKWLQAGKVPGHKLGRQWRFLKAELELHVSGQGRQIQVHKEIIQLGNLLIQRSRKESFMNPTPTPRWISEQLIWDAYDHGARLIHISPSKGRFEVRYRDRKGMEALTEIGEDTFQCLNEEWRRSSTPIREEDMRRFSLSRDENDTLQIRYQLVETVTGPMITLRLWQPLEDVLPLEKIVSGKEEPLNTFRSWARKKHGLIVLSGNPGSGKTTTFYAMLNEVKKTGSVIFTIESPVYLVIDGVNQVELTRPDSQEFERAFEKIYHSDPDVIGLGLGSYAGMGNVLFDKAIEAAMTGHLVILQMNAGSCEEALEVLKQNTKWDAGKSLVGISHQKLITTPKGIQAQYQFFTPSVDH